MRERFFDIVFTPDVKTQQMRHNSRAAYAGMGDENVDKSISCGLTEREVAFLGHRDSFYLASVSETGWPYVQHRGGPAGFVRRIDDKTIGWAEFAGNQQYVSIGNAIGNDRVALIFMDYLNRRRLKILGHMRIYDASQRPDLAHVLVPDGYKARVERFVMVDVEAFDWNCPQHITPRYTLKEIESLVAPLHARIAQLEAQLLAHEPILG